VLASFATTPEQNSIDVISQNIVCPDEFTGLVPWNQCSIYFYCLIGVPYPPIMQCEAGKLFDVEAKTCLDSLQVTCAPSTEDKNLMQYTISSGVHMGLPNMPTTITQSETSNDESNIRLIAGIVILFCGSLILFLLVLTKRRQSICREF
jgi:hypothetical protein